MDVWSLCALSADELLLACGAAGLRALSLHTEQLAAHEPSALSHVYSVAFDNHTDTLLLVLWSLAVGNYQLVSLRRNASEWPEVHRLKISLNVYQYVVMDVCDSRVLLGQLGGTVLYVDDVSANHSLHYAGNVTLPSAINGVACTRRGNDTLVAFAHNSSVSLQRLASRPLRLEPLASVNLTAPWRLLFRGDLLLAADWNRDNVTQAIVSFRATDNALTERRVLRDAQNSVHVIGWTLAGEKLVVSQWNRTEETSGDLIVYDFA